MNKVCLMITGQMRTYKMCFSNILERLIITNSNYEFHIFILTEYCNGKNGGTSKNNFINKEDNYYEFKQNIEKVYGKYIKCLIIDINKIQYPSYIKHYGPWICLYKNKILLDSIQNLNDYDIFIRMRPDIKLSNKIHLENLNNIHDTIHIISGGNTRNNSWLHNRDWDHMCICNLKGMKLWCEYYKFLEVEPPCMFTNEVRFNNKGFWCKYENKDKSITATQLFFNYIIDNKYKLNFDALNIFTILIR